MTDTVAEIMRAKLAAAFQPEHLEVIDESEEHRGHHGWHEGGSHFRVVMRARALADLSRVERSRAVHRALEAELTGGVHALALDLSA